MILVIKINVIFKSTVVNHTYIGHGPYSHLYDIAVKELLGDTENLLQVTEFSDH